MKKYEEKFKRQILRDYFTLGKDGAVEIDGVVVENVRNFCEATDISKDTLYRWRNEIDMTKDKGVTKSKKKSKKNPVKKEESKDEEDFGFAQDSDFILTVDNSKLMVRSEIRFYGFLASLFGIKRYNNMRLSQLKLKIGLRMIKDSGLVDMDFDGVVD